MGYEKIRVNGEYVECNVCGDTHEVSFELCPNCGTDGEVELN